MPRRVRASAPGRGDPETVSRARRAALGKGLVNEPGLALQEPLPREKQERTRELNKKVTNNHRQNVNLI